MRHRAHGRKLGRKPGHRKALFRNQLTSLFAHEQITTTVEKAKELQPIAERMVTLARRGDISARRRVERMVRDREVLRRLFDEIAPRFTDRPGGYTRIIRLGRRHGDNAEMALIQFVDVTFESRATVGEGDEKRSFVDRAKGAFGGGGAAAAASTEGESTDEGTEPVDETETDTETETETDSDEGEGKS